MLVNETTKENVPCEAACGEPRLPIRGMRTCGRPECLTKVFAPPPDPPHYVKSEENHG